MATDKMLALYDLETDIGEAKDVANRHPELAVKRTKIIAELE